MTRVTRLQIDDLIEWIMQDNNPDTPYNEIDALEDYDNQREIAKTQLVEYLKDA